MKVLYSYLLIITLPMIAFGLASYYWLTNAIEKETHAAYSSVLEDIRGEIDRNFQTLDTFAVQLSYMPWATQLMNMEGDSFSYDRLDIGLLLNILQELRIFQATYPFVDELAIDFKSKNTVLSSVGKDSRERFFTDLMRYSRRTADDWSALLGQLNNRTILLPEEVRVLNQPKRLLTYLHALPPGDSGFQATLLLFVREETIQELLGKSAVAKAGGSVYVTDSEGRLVTDYHGDPGVAAALQQRIPREAGYTLYRSAEGANGWTYHLAVPTGALAAKLESVRLVAAGLVLFYLAVGVAISLLLARRDYRPVAQMLSLVGSRRRAADNEHNEYRILEKTIYAMLGDADRSESEMLLYKPLARNTCLAKLLRDETGQADMARTMELLDITFPHDEYRCLIVLLGEEQTVPEPFFAQVNAGLDARAATVYWVELEGRSKAVILNVENEAAGERALEAIRGALQSMNVAYRAIGVGRPCAGPGELHLSYADAQRALEYRFTQEDGATLYAERFEEAVYWKGAIREEEEIKAALKAGHAAAAVDKARRVVRAEAQGHRLPLGAIRFLCYRVAVVAFLALEELNIAEAPAVSLNGLLQQKELDAMLDAIAGLYEDAVRLVAAEREGRNDHLVRDIKSYLEAHFTDQNLSLTAVADAFGISSSYLSRYFKSQTGTNFIDYVNRCRIEAAKRLLPGDATIVQIAHKVGFDNDITFRRLFKKYMGITPSQFKGYP